MITSDPKRLFSPGGCLTASTIRNYMNGSLRLSSKLQVDEHLKKCLMCSEALEGYRSHSRRVYIHSDLEYLTKKVRRTYSRPSYPLEGKLPLLIFISVIASLVILLTVFYIFNQSIPAPSKSAGAKPDTVQQVTSPDSVMQLH